MYVTQRIARAGLASRRQAQRLLDAGKVLVDGQPALANVRVEDGQVVTVDGQPLQTLSTKVLMYYKRRGELVTANDPKGRPTIFDKFPKNLPHVMPVGRLDFSSEGLLLLTNCGQLARYLEHPKSEILRRYEVCTNVPIKESAIEKLRQGVTVEGIAYKPMKILRMTPSELAQDGPNSHSWLEITLREGKNREIRRTLEHFGASVHRLRRVQYGPYMMEKLTHGGIQDVGLHPALSKAFEKASRQAARGPPAR